MANAVAGHGRDGGGDPPRQLGKRTSSECKQAQPTVFRERERAVSASKLLNPKTVILGRKRARASQCEQVALVTDNRAGKSKRMSKSSQCELRPTSKSLLRPTSKSLLRPMSKFLKPTIFGNLLKWLRLGQGLGPGLVARG